MKFLTNLLIAVAVVMFVMAGSPESVSSGLATPAMPAVLAAPPAAPPVSEARTEAERRTSTALSVLSSLVPVQSSTSALQFAFEAYFNYRSLHPDEVRKPYLYFVDFGLPSTEPRGWVFDMDHLQVVEGPFTVAHGRGSTRERYGVPSSFSNREGSNATSLGLYVAAETYQFRGKSGGSSYRSVGLRLDGVSGGFNSSARQRGIVAHGAPYVTANRAGRSEGCPAMEPARAERLLPMISGGGMVFLFSPEDREWMKMDPWVHNTLEPDLGRFEIATFM